MSNLGITGRIVLLSVALPTAWAWWAPTTGALSFRTRTYWSTPKHEHTTEATCNPRCPPIIRAAVNNNMEADRLEHIDTPSANNPLETSTSRGDWLRTGAGLAAMVPLVSSVLLGSPADAAAARAGSGTVTVIGAGGKTGRECVEYLAASGTGEYCSFHVLLPLLACILFVLVGVVCRWRSRTRFQTHDVVQSRSRS